MKKLLNFIVLILFAISVHSQNYHVLVEGTVSHDNGDPVSDIQVNLYTDSFPSGSGNFFYQNTLLTDTNGFYRDTFTVPNSLPFGFMFGEVVDCDGDLLQNASFWMIDSAYMIMDFIYCDTTFIPWPDSCITHITCDPGAPLMAVTTGIPPFVYEWVDSNGVVVSTEEFYLPNDPGYFCVTVTDADSCVSNACIDYMGQNPFDSCWTFISQTHTGTGIILSADNFGIPPFQYAWSSGDSTQTIQIGGADSSQYCVTVTDAMGCVSDACTQTWGIDSSCFVFITQVIDPAGFFIRFRAEGIGVAPFTYVWHDGSTSQEIDYSGPGNYCVTMTDATGCSSTSCEYYDFGSGQDSLCSSFIFPLSGVAGWVLVGDAYGIPPFSYDWSTGDTTDIINYVSPGNYCLTITDATGCASTYCEYFDLNGGIDSSCWSEVYPLPNAGLIVQAFGGMPPYTYSWTTGETTDIIYPLSAGFYCATVTDALGCVSESCTFYAPGNTDSCSTFIIDTLAGSGVYLIAIPDGVAPFNYLWDDGSTSNSIMAQPNQVHCVTVTDAVGCVSTACNDWGVSPQEFEINGFILPIDTTSGTIETVTGWTYLIDATDFSVVDSTWINDSLNVSTYHFGNVAAGDYLVYVDPLTSSNGINYIPTYHVASIFWDEAEIITVPHTSGDIYPVLMWEIDPQPLTGNGSISGAVWDGPQIKEGQVDIRSAEGIANIPVILMEVSTGNIVGYMKTDAQGAFSFNNLNWGTYEVYVDVLGKTSSFARVTLSANHPSNNNVAFNVNDTDVTTTSGINDLINEDGLMVYPNPAADILNIEMNVVKSADFTVQISSLTGELKYIEDLKNVFGPQQIKVDLADLSSGMYMVQFINNKEIITRKISVQK